MSVFPNNALEPLVTIHTFSLESLGFGITSYSSGAAWNNLGSSTWIAANRALFIPFVITKPTLIKQLFVLNGAAVSGNIDVGIYDAAGTKIVSSGSTAQAGTTVIQSFDVTDTMLAPGQYYFAVALDNSTGTLLRVTVGGSGYRQQELGMAQQSTAFPLPATATFATIASDYIPVVGLTTRALI
jgi:hypothetical protein